MKIAIVSTTKNECDVIESFVRHNSRFGDKFFFIDESHDTTRAILAQLQATGFNLQVFDSPTHNYQQNQLIGGAMQHIASLNEFDWILLLDADEIIGDVTREQFEQCLARVPPGAVATIAWKTFIPKSLNYFHCADPITENFLPRKSEGTSGGFFKVFIPKCLFGIAAVSPGNHFAIHKQQGSRLPEVLMPMPLGHFPVRSAEQIVIKNIIATHNHTMKENKVPGEGFHVYATLEQMRKVGFQLSYEELKRVAMSYAAQGTDAQLDIDLTSTSIRREKQEVRFRNLFTKNVVATLDAEIELLVKKLMGYKKIVSSAKELLGKADEKSASA